MKENNLIDLTKEVLEKAEYPLSTGEIWNEIESMGKGGGFNSKKPVKNLGISLAKHLETKNPLFVEFSQYPKRFWLKSREIDSEKMEKIIETKQNKENEYSFKERDLHPLLVKFVKESKEFGLHCKTIDHTKRSTVQAGKNYWIHPDIVGVSFFSELKPQTMNFLRNLNQPPCKLYSFELKISLTFKKLKKFYSQATHNSSWANEGYLVTLKCDNEDMDFINELWRLNSVFGIGVIKLDAKNVLDSEVLIPAKNREGLDFKTIDLLVGNSDFRGFIENVNHRIEANLKSDFDDRLDFDEVLDDEAMDQYIKNKKIKE